MDKKILILFLGIFLIGIVSATYCCEKTLSGAWCQPVSDKNLCDNSEGLSAPAPTSCDATSFCQMGTCIDKEGVCKRNTAQRTCQESGGYWIKGNPEDIKQCQKGCCFIGGVSANFVEQARCTSISSAYNVPVDFRANIQNALQCILSITSDVKGACIFEEELGKKTCKFVTQKECLDAGGEFNQDILCSASWLNTTCGMSDKTTCSDEKVYFTDTCGNLANIYDSNRKNDQIYWTSVIAPELSCGYGESNANSATCGNCEYYFGSTCKTYKRGETSIPQIGNYICKDLSCKYEGKTYQQGERWCATNTKGNLDKNLPGAESFVLECRDGEVISEACSVGEWRNIICIQEDVEGFKNAECRVNLWQDCVLQDNKESCLDNEARYCNWIENYDFGIYNHQGAGVCVPKYAPGFDFWDGEGEAKDDCSLGTVKCTVTYKKSLLDLGKFEYNDCSENCECLPEDPNYQTWLNKMNLVCSSLGDCGSSVNYAGEKGYNKLNATKV